MTLVTRGVRKILMEKFESGNKIRTCRNKSKHVVENEWREFSKLVRDVEMQREILANSQNKRGTPTQNRANSIFPFTEAPDLNLEKWKQEVPT